MATDDETPDPKIAKLAEILQRHLPTQPWFINVWIPNAPNKGWRVIREITHEPDKKDP